MPNKIKYRSGRRAEHQQIRPTLDVLVSRAAIRQQATTNYFKPPQPTKLLRDFKKSQIMRDFYHTCAAYLREKSIPDTEKLQQYFAGSLFQQLGYYFLTTTVGFDRTVLSPADAFDFYHFLYPDAKIIVHPFGDLSLEGISPPDGMIVDSASKKIISLVEFTARGLIDIVRNKLQALVQDRDNYLGLFSDSSLLFVHLAWDNLIPSSDPDVEYQSTHVSSPKYGQYASHIYSNYKPQFGAPTLAQLEAENRAQNHT